MDQQSKTYAMLQRFYGGDPLQWGDMPAMTLEEFVDALPILEAQERLAFIVDCAVGFGSVKKGFGATHRRRLQRIAESGDGKRVIPADLAKIKLMQMGFGVNG